MEARRLETETSSRLPKPPSLKARLLSFTKSVKRGGSHPIQNDIVSAATARSIGTTLSQIFAATGGFGLSTNTFSFTKLLVRPLLPGLPPLSPN